MFNVRNIYIYKMNVCKVSDVTLTIKREQFSHHAYITMSQRYMYTFLAQTRMIEKYSEYI